MSTFRYKLSEVANASGCLFCGQDNTVERVLTDSRSMCFIGDMFVALVGDRHNGHDYIGEMYLRGVRNFMVNKGFDTFLFPSAGFIIADDTLRGLQNFAAHHRSKFKYTVAGITGSNGKTTVKEWIYQLLNGSAKIIRNPKSYNSQTGVPLSVLLMDNSADLAIFEAGISQPDEMRYLQKIIDPTIGILTNIGDAHGENFLSDGQKLHEKLVLFKNCKLLVYNADNDFIHSEIMSSKNEFKTFTWGRSNFCDLKVNKQGNSFELTTKGSVFYISDFKYTDSASVENMLHCVAFALAAGYSHDVIIKNIGSLTRVEMRLELKQGINGCTIINDTYNSDFNSLKIAFDFLNGLTLNGKKTVILSDIMQSNISDGELYRDVATAVNSNVVHRFIGIGEKLTKNAYLFDLSKSVFYKNTDEFIFSLSKGDFNRESVLLKGSRAFKFERILQLLEYKSHQTILEVNMNAMVHNLNYYKSKVPIDVKIMAMVKAFSYGAGSYEVAALLQHQRVDYLAVAYTDEGVALRDAGITMPIVILNSEPDSFDIMIVNKLEPEIYNFSSLDAFLRAAERLNVHGYPVHIKIDTGMHRLGFIESEVAELCKILQSENRASVASVFSHLVGSDEDVHDDFTLMQINTFSRVCDFIASEINKPFLRHILNSGGIDRFTDYCFDMVRLGIGLYGYGTHKQHLQIASTLSSAIVQTKHIPQGETIGYGRNGKAVTPKKTATVPVGYADGLNRKLSNGNGYFVVNGKRAPIIGNICMDTCMIDITDIEAEEGDRVIIMGEDPSAEDIAQKLGTIAYEVLTGISQRVKRVYFSD